MAAEEHVSTVELGFAEECDENWRLLSHYFPSKLGGKPAWLSLKPLPSFESTLCKKCGDPCVFLLQLYSPIEDRDDCFHRTIFLFACQNGACYKANSGSNFVVLRSQVPRVNEFYSNEPPNDKYFDPKLVYPRAENYSMLCVVCGCAGLKKCSQCHEATYCGKKHQVSHWKNGHKAVCGGAQGHSTKPSKKLLFSEYEIVIETEKMNEEKDTKSEEEKMKEYEEYMSNLNVTEHLQSTELDSMAVKESKSDKQFAEFKKRISLEPEQVIRYKRNGNPLWVSSDNVPTPADIPKCSCGTERIFEFQVLPQLLTYLDVDKAGDSIDWGTLAVYTCSNSCNSELYMEEFLWKQDYSSA